MVESTHLRSKIPILTSVLRESYVLVYKLVDMGLIAVEYIKVDRTGVNAYSIRIKL